VHRGCRGAGLGKLAQWSLGRHRAGDDAGAARAHSRSSIPASDLDVARTRRSTTSP